MKPTNHNDLVVLQGYLTVAHRRRGREFCCTALQFDLVGFGRTKREAFDELRLLVEEYVENVIKAPGPVRFFNPSEADDWNAGQLEDFYVALQFRRRGDVVPPPCRLSDLGPLKVHRKALEGVSLVPAGQ